MARQTGPSRRHFGRAVDRSIAREHGLLTCESLIDMPCFTTYNKINSLTVIVELTALIDMLM